MLVLRFFVSYGAAWIVSSTLTMLILVNRLPYWFCSSRNISGHLRVTLELEYLVFGHRPNEIILTSHIFWVCQTFCVNGENSKNFDRIRIRLNGFSLHKRSMFHTSSLHFDQGAGWNCLIISNCLRRRNLFVLFQPLYQYDFPSTLSCPCFSSEHVI